MALFFKHHEEIPADKQVQDLPLAKIIPNQFQPRHQFTDDSINELAQTLSTEGLLQPIAVRKHDDQYEIIAGERRFRAAQKLGWKTIPGIVRDLTDEQTASLALIENLQREDLNPIDEAKAYQRLMKLNDLTQLELAKQVGKSQSYVANKIRLLKLSEPVQAALVAKNISQRHGRALLALTASRQGEALQKILDQHLNVQATEKLVESYQQPAAKPTSPKNRVYVKADKDFKVQINTIKQAVNLARESGLQVKMKESKAPNQYRIVIELSRKQGK
ncbi:MAG: nucleoid occlusion protein [Lactobacillus sp.]|jgi:ParB family chromosome partitioning protein|nr:nucleoid occlusion protein [Lactobacillus sp.]MCH3905602.1 nucleoid occlusion protein [Lactobacillus sp.]MCH3990839.1 nucleoid occlusion protein [Lactobacillus sp.]MCH4068445.1 nucleoid occlusion protein [Lactobacillus sp.]MCI1304194.1 nucleoid occlusion protein [Lactobacillus sp.]